jgi:Raf kinase inhibitor-like YbhB/YbcL family protein
MLGKLPGFVGKALSRIRAGIHGIAIQDEGLAAPHTVDLQLRSSTFRDHGPLPARYTADGAGVSPPLAWSKVPLGTRSLVLLVEDADSPTPRPLVHAIAAVDPHRHRLPEGALSSTDTADLKLGRNSFFGAGYTPPDPPPGHGPHRYVFELFALDHTPRLGHRPGRNKIKSEMRGHVIGRGALTAVYERHA